jgi:3-dehydroquinate synthase
MVRYPQLTLKSNRERSYVVHVGIGLFKRIPAMILRDWKGRGVFIITDANVRRLYGTQLQHGLTSSGMSPLMLDVPAGENAKSLKIVTALYTQLLQHGLRRDSLIVALGGGVIGDLAGFVAATALRGITFVQVPTSLVAQVDSSVGGKVGINHALGKNLIGAFHPPAAVFIDPALLQSLTQREFRNGLAEVVKIAFALAPDFFTWLERHGSDLRKPSGSVLRALVSRSVWLKASIVARDEFDRGIRRVLNFGHTIGHALEASTRYQLSHGEAVSIGMAAEAKIAAEIGLLKRADYQRLVHLLKALRLPSRIPADVSKARFLAAIGLDKKSDITGTKFVLPRRIGEMLIGIDVPTPFVRSLWGQ